MCLVLSCDQLYDFRYGSRFISAETQKMSVKFRIPRDHYSDFERISELGPDILKAVVELWASLPKLPLTSVALRRTLKNIVPGTTTAQALVRQLVALSHLIRQRDLSVEDVIDSLNEGISNNKDWSVEQRASWALCEPAIRQLLVTDVVRVVSKASDLAYDHANLFQGARIVADVRPVFNDFEDSNIAINGAIVSFTMRLHYDNRSGDNGLSLALDEGDILLLKEQCERAIEKAKFVRDFMEKQGKIPTVISGEQNDDDE